jgi:hypothetical protein
MLKKQPKALSRKDRLYTYPGKALLFTPGKILRIQLAPLQVAQRWLFFSKFQLSSFHNFLYVI